MRQFSSGMIMSSLESSCTSRNVRVELRVAFAAQLVFEEMQESAGPGPFMIQTTLRDADGNALYRPGVGTVSRPLHGPGRHPRALVCFQGRLYHCPLGCLQKLCPSSWGENLGTFLSRVGTQLCQS